MCGTEKAVECQALARALNSALLLILVAPLVDSVEKF